jgi:hypothetical protein
MRLEQPSAQLVQRHVRPPLDFGQDRGVLRRELQHLLIALRPGGRLTRHPPSLQRLVKERNTDIEPLRRSPRRQPAIHRRQNPLPQIRRIALPRPPRHHASPDHHNQEV